MTVVFTSPITNQGTWGEVWHPLQPDSAVQLLPGCCMCWGWCYAHLSICGPHSGLVCCQHSNQVLCRKGGSWSHLSHSDLQLLQEICLPNHSYGSIFQKHWYNLQINTFGYIIVLTFRSRWGSCTGWLRPADHQPETASGSGSWWANEGGALLGPCRRFWFANGEADSWRKDIPLDAQRRPDGHWQTEWRHPQIRRRCHQTRILHQWKAECIISLHDLQYNLLNGVSPT